MKQKLFENLGGNTFKLITESVVEDNPKASLVREGLKKVFSAGDKSLSYKRLQGVGMGYIKSVEEAKKTAIQEARELAKEYGYVENENAQAFVKEDEHDRIDPDQKWDTVPQLPKHNETDMSNSEEAQEVQIGKEILSLISGVDGASTTQELYDVLTKIVPLAQKLITMHGQK